MREWHVVVCYVIEEVDLVFLQQQTCGDGVDRRVTPTFIEEATILVERIEEVEVCLRPKPIKITDFEIGPLSERIRRVL